MMRRILFVLVLAALLVGTASAVLPVTDGLVAEYNFVQGEDPAVLYDISGNGHHGTIIGGATWTDEGLLLDGATAYVHNINLGNLGPDYTVITVAKTEKDANQVIFGRISTTVHNPTGKGFLIRKTGSAHIWSHMHYDGVANPEYLKDVRTMQPTGDWVMLTARADASSVEMIGGPKVTGGEAVSSGMVDHSGEYFIGRLSYANTWHFQGTIGYIAVYDRKLSDAELLAVQASIRDNMAKRGVVLPDPHQIIKPMVVLQTDDGLPSDYTTAYPLASARNIPLTYHVIAARIGNPGQLTWDQIHELRAAGFGIECHNYNHVDITTLTEAELRANLEAVNAAFIAAGLPTPEHHAYARGQNDAASRAILADYRLSGRTTNHLQTPIMYWGQEFDWYQLRSKSIVRDTTVDEIKGLIDDAIAQNYVLILYTHDISDDPGEVGCYTDRFEEILDYIAAKRDAGLIEPVTIDGLYRAMQGIRTRPATGPMTLHGETTGATYDKTVDYVGFVWGTTRHNNPEGTAPGASGYDNHWISTPGDYREDEFSYMLPGYAAGTEYYYRAAARIDGTWYYGEELTYASAAPFDPTGWTYDPLVITIPAGSVTEPLDNFPVMIKLDRDSGANGADLRGILAVLGSDANRKRIAVATADGTLCPVEIAEWSTADRRAILWVKVPRIEPGQDTKLYLYFDPAHAEMTQYVGDTGEPAAQQVWSNGYAGVWLMKPNGGQVLDSTANGNHGTIYGATAIQGPLGTAMRFDGVDDYISIPSYTTKPSDFTLVAGIDLPRPPPGESTIFFGRGPLVDRWWLSVQGGGSVHFQLSDGISYRGLTVDTYNTNNYPPGVSVVALSVAADLDAGSSDAKYYRHGMMVKNALVSGVNQGTAQESRIAGGGSADASRLTGDIHIVTLSEIARSPAWIAATNAVLHDTFVTYTFDATGWTYDPLVITIPAGSVTEPLDNFPVMIKLDRDSGANGADLRGILDVLGSDANRKRIAVATADGTPCPVEIAEWSTADRRAILWVKVPRIEPGQDTRLYLYFDPAHAEMTQYVGDTGEPAAQQVWDEHYAGVWLMKPNGGRVLDSTANGNHGTIYGATATQGPTGTALAFDGVDDYVDCGNSVTLDPGANDFTLEVMAKANSGNIYRAIVSKGGWHSNGFSIQMRYTPHDDYCFVAKPTGSGYVYVRLGLPTAWDWKYIGGSRSGNTLSAVVDGIARPDNPVLPPDASLTSSQPLLIGKYVYSGDSYCFNGEVGFVALSTTARSPAWIAAQNAVLHDTFVTYTYTYDGPPIALFHTTPAHTLTVICTDLSLGNPTSWHWDFGDGRTSTEQNPTHTYASPGTYTITLTVTNAYGTDTHSTTLHVAPPSSVSFTYTVDGPELATGVPIHFQGLISSDATSWRWYFGDGATSEERNPTHTYSKTGTYRVTLTAINEYGSISFSQNLHVFTGNIPDPTPPPTHGAAFRWDPETGYYTSYWFNREGSFIDVHGLFFALMLPLKQIFGSWVFLIIWGTLCMGLYLYTQDTTMPFIVGILGGSMMAFLMGEDALVVMLLTMAFAGGGILAKVLLGRV